MDFNRRDTELLRDIDGLQGRVDKQTHTYPGVFEARDGAREPPVALAQREAALGRDLLSLLRDERCLKGLDARRDPDDFGVGAQFQIEDGAHAARERGDIGVLDMAPVLAQMNRDAVGARTLGGGGRLDGIGLVRFARFTDRRDVINVDVETHGVLPSGHLVDRSCLVKRRLALALLVLAGSAACGKNPGAGAPVPQSMNESVAQFFTAVKGNDLTRMGQLWGTERGPAADNMNPAVLHQRLTVIQKYLDHTGYRIIEGPLVVPGHDELRTFRVELQRTNCNQVLPIDLVRTRSGGWLVYDVHLESAGSPGGRCPQAGTGTRP